VPRVTIYHGGLTRLEADTETREKVRIPMVWWFVRLDYSTFPADAILSIRIFATVESSADLLRVLRWLLRGV
jgi:hypothetical protein